MKQHITQEQAMTLVNSDAQRVVEGGPEYVTALCNAAIQHYLDEQAKELPELPELPAVFTTTETDVHTLMHSYALAWGDARAAHARDKALDEAMQECDKLSHNYSSPECAVAWDCKDAIEALKGK